MSSESETYAHYFSVLGIYNFDYVAAVNLQRVLSQRVLGGHEKELSLDIESLQCNAAVGPITNENEKNFFVPEYKMYSFKSVLLFKVSPLTFS